MVNALARLGGLEPGNAAGVDRRRSESPTPKGGLMALMATHPPIEERIAALQGMQRG